MPTHSLRVLMVENHPVFADTVTRLFLSDHAVDCVATLGGARAALSTKRFDVVLVDFDLDDGKGEVLVRELIAAHFPGRIIGISAHDDGNRALLLAGAHACCPKAHFDTIARFLW